MFRPRPINVRIDAPTQYVDRNMTIHEHRAPTDESVALLHEMEQAAKNKIISAVRLSDNTFECVVHGEQDMMSHDMVFTAIFKLNGLTDRCEVRVPIGKDDSVAVAVMLRDAVASKIAESMLDELFRAVVAAPQIR